MASDQLRTSSDASELIGAHSEGGRKANHPLTLSGGSTHPDVLCIHKPQNSTAQPSYQSWKRQDRRPDPRNVKNLLSEALSIGIESAIEAGALGFMARALVQATLPHRAQRGTVYTRTDGDLTLSIVDLAGVGLPYGSYPRLLLIWITTEALRTKSRSLELGGSLSSFMAQLGLTPTGGRWGTIPRLRDQMQRLFSAAISTRWTGKTRDLSHLQGNNLIVADDFDLWWNPRIWPPRRSGNRQ